MITEEINECVEKLLTDLRNFQDRQHLRDPTKVGGLESMSVPDDCDYAE